MLLSKTSLIDTILIACMIMRNYVLIHAKIIDDCVGYDDLPCLDCQIKTMSADELMLSQAARSFFGKEHNLKLKNHSLDQLQVFDCQCQRKKVTISQYK